MKRIGSLIVAFLALFAFALSASAAGESSNPASEEEAAPIPVGTVITEANWQHYKQFMNSGMQALWAGTYQWKLGPDFKLVIGPTRHYPQPPQYVKYTEEYASKVRIKTLPDGRHLLENYVAGLPFPNPQEPMKGWKILTNDWYAYVPRIICNDSSGQVFRDRMGDVTSNQFVVVLRIFDHIADKGMPITDKSAPNFDYVEYFELTKPEQAKYTASMTIYYRDQTRNEDTFLFVPALRRTLRLSTAARCSPLFGSDATNDDTRHGAFNGNITKFDAQYLGDHLVIVMPDPDVIKAGLLKNFIPPLYFPKPDVGKWEVRNTSVIDVRRIPSLRKGYCYGKRIMYCDTESHMARWAELYDQNMKMWKIFYDPQSLVKVPGEGRYWTNGGWGTIIDVQNIHESWVYLSGPTGPFRANSDCSNVDGRNLTDGNRYSSVGGLSQIMR